MSKTGNLIEFARAHSLLTLVAEEIDDEKFLESPPNFVYLH